MGAKDSKLSCISYEEAIKRGKVFFQHFFLSSSIINENGGLRSPRREEAKKNYKRNKTTIA